MILKITNGLNGYHRNWWTGIDRNTQFCLKTASKKYVDINGKVSKDKWQSMFRYLAKYVKTLFSGFFHDRMTVLLKRDRGRVERGNFTLTLSQNRAWKSPLTRLFTLNVLCIDIIWGLTSLPMIEKTAVFARYLLQPTESSCQREQSIKQTWMLCRVQPRLQELKALTMDLRWKRLYFLRTQ